jgi:DNA polymerase I-like protein with 3'-5' exonuclease and polymerase domains
MRCYWKAKERGLRALPIVTVHDSNGFDCPVDELEELAVIMAETLEDVSIYPWAIVPFPVEFAVGGYWQK